MTLSPPGRAPPDDHVDRDEAGENDIDMDDARDDDVNDTASAAIAFRRALGKLGHASRAWCGLCRGPYDVSLWAATTKVFCSAAAQRCTTPGPTTG
jgi:hypothetical protein